MKKLFSLTLVLVFLGVFLVGCGNPQPPAPAPAPTPSPTPVPTPAPALDTQSSLKLEKTAFSPGEEINLTFVASADCKSNAWIGIIPSNISHGSESENDKHDVRYQYLKGKKSGVLKFKAPTKPGNYDFRLNSTDSNGVEVTYISFTVGTTTPTPTTTVTASLKLEKTTFATGEEIKLTFVASDDCKSNAWIGIIPSNIAHGSESENDKHDVRYKYLKGKKSGVLIFKAPTKPGNYDFRLNNTDSNGKEVTYTSFVVSSKTTAPSGAATLKLDKKVYNPMEVMTINYTTPTGFKSTAWIGIIPTRIPHGNEATNDKHDVRYKYLKGKTSGVLTLKAPNKSGNWDVRMNNAGKEYTYISFVVRGSEPKGPTLTLDKTVYAPGEEITITFTAPGHYPSNAWIGIIPSEINHGKEAENDKHDVRYRYLKKKTSGVIKFKAPTKKGKWDVRMNDSDSNGKEVVYVSFEVK